MWSGAIRLVRGPDMRLWAVSHETGGSDRSEPVAVGVSDPLG